MAESYYIKPLEEQKHIRHIVKVLDNNNKIRRGELFTLVQEKEAKLYNKKPYYQTINRDIQRLIDKGYISIISGGPRSQVLTLSRKGEDLLNKVKK